MRNPNCNGQLDEVLKALRSPTLNSQTSSYEKLQGTRHACAKTFNHLPHELWFFKSQGSPWTTAAARGGMALRRDSRIL